MTALRDLVGKPCPVCNSFYTCGPKDEEYIRCLECGMVRTKYNYDASQYGEGYSENYKKYAETPTNIPLNLFRLGLVSRWLQTNDKILDIGCCIGEFIRFAEPYYICLGFEPNAIAAIEAAKRVKSKIIVSLHKGIYNIDCVTMFDVLEHIEDPLALLRQIYVMLNPLGVLVITTPNVLAVPSWSDEQLRKWKHYKPLEHLMLHTEDSLTALTEKSGFELLHVGCEESDIRPGNPNSDILTFVARKVLR